MQSLKFNTIDKYLKQADTDIVQKFKNKQSVDSKIIEELSKNCLDDIKNLLNKNYLIPNITYNRELLELRAYKYILNVLGYKNSNLLLDENSKEYYKTIVKRSLYMMIIKTFEEILYLLEGGFSVCANARLRYIYEACVLLEILNRNSDSFSKQFFIESEKTGLKIANEMNDEEYKLIIKNHIKGKVAPDKFKVTYNWAKNDSKINCKSPTFYKLAKSTRYGKKYIIYVDSCKYVHADLYGLFTRIDKIPSEKIHTWRTTPSLYGLPQVINNLIFLIASSTLDYYSHTPNSITTLAIGLSELLLKKIKQHN